MIKKNGIILAFAAVMLLTGCRKTSFSAVTERKVIEDSPQIVADLKGDIAEWERKWGPFDGNMNLEEDEWLALGGQFYLGRPGTLLIRDKDNIKFIKDYAICVEGIISLTDPQLMVDTSKSNNNLGICSLGENQWILEPEYSMIRKSDDDFCYSRVDHKEHQYQFYDGDWNLIFHKSWKDSNVYIVEGIDEKYIWVQDGRGEKTFLYDLNGKKLRTLELPTSLKDGTYYAWENAGGMMDMESACICRMAACISTAA